MLGITDPAVTIKNIEMAIIDRGFEEGWVQPKTPNSRTGKTIAIVGSAFFYVTASHLKKENLLLKIIKKNNVY